MNNKKILALILAFAMMFSSITVAFADTTATIGADAEALKTMGVLQGENSNGVTPEYLAKETTRMQAAIMFLRLKGLEDEAMAFTGTANFADVNTMTWADGKAIMAYLKANPQLGWVGVDGGKFDPFTTITAQQYYKVMLEALGYKQTTAEVVGDFSWADVITFAASKGLVKVANVTKFTNNDVAIATVEALKTNVKDAATTLVAAMVEAGMINRDAAIAAGLLEEATTDAELDSVMAVANDKVEVGFSADVTKAFAENKANFKIVVKGSTTALEVVKAELGSDPSYVILTTAAQTGGTAYTMTVGSQSINFAGAAKSADTPKVDTVKAIDTNTVEVVFTKAMDRASVENVANYVLNNGATVKSAELWASQDDSRKTVRLTTEGVTNSKVYSLKIQNVKSSDLVAMATVTKNFTGITDTKAPSINGAVEVQNNARIIVKFDDQHGINKASAENAANWSIKDYEGNALNIVSITAKDLVSDNYDKYDAVEIATETMTSGKKYTVAVNNLSDDSVAKNVTTKELSKTFTGKAADKTAPTIISATAISDTAIKVVFNDQNRLDASTITNISNYTFAKDIEVVSAKILRPTKPDLALGKTVILTTTAMSEDIKTYALTITGIADEFGNVIKTYNKSISYKAEDVTAPYVKSVAWVNLNTVKLTFDDMLDSVSAEDAANYSLNNNIGTVTKAVISGNDTDQYKVVTLTVPTMEENKSYTITINGVKDLVGNATSNAKAYFTSQRDGMDITRPTIVTTDILSDKEVRVTFDEKVKTNGGTPIMTVRYDSNNDGSITGTDSAVTYTMKGQLLDDKTTMVFESGNTTATGNTENEFRVEGITFVSDMSNNKFVADTDDYETFFGTDATNEAATVDSIEQVDPLTIVVMFDKPVTVDAPNAFSGFTATVDVDGDDTNDAESTLTLKASSALVYDKEYKFDLSAHVDDYMGTAVTDTGDTTTDIIAGIDDEDKPVIDYVEAISTNKLQVHYNEDLSYEGTYKIYEDGKTTPVSGLTVTAAINKDDSSIVDITLNNALKANGVYQIKPASSARDLAGNKADTADVEFSFVGSTVVPFNYIKGVTIIDADTIRVYANINLGTAVTVTNAAGVDIAAGAATYPKSTDHTYVQVDLSEPIVDGEKYVVDETSVTVDSYTFTGNMDNGGLEIENGIISFSGSDLDEYVVKVVYANGGAFTTLYVRPTGTEFDATTEMYTYDGLTQVSLADVLANSTEYTIAVYRTTGIADGTVTGAEADWDAYKTIIDGNIDNSPLYTTKIAD